MASRSEVSERIAQRTGISRFNWQLAASVRHRRWLFRGGSGVPAPALTFRDPDPVGPQELALCERLIAAYRAALAQSDDGTPEGMWGELAEARQRELGRALLDGDAHALAMLLSTLFQQEFILGIATGSLVSHGSGSWLGQRVWSLKILDQVVSLGEALGAVRTENPEQGVAGHALANGEAALVEAIERHVGVGLDFPRAGAAYGIELAGRLVTLDSAEQLYAAWRIREALALHAPEVDAPRIVEIGAGYGGMAYWVTRVLPGLAGYTIVDLPRVNVFQGYFLARVLGPDAVSFCGEPPARVAVLPTTATRELDGPFDLLANKDSMPEMPEAVVDDYLAWAKDRVTGLFYSCNQEAFSPWEGVPQTLVPEAVARVGGFRRLRRDPSWVRAGYVEEIYVGG
jgi:hypothetical protein